MGALFGAPAARPLPALPRKRGRVPDKNEIATMSATAPLAATPLDRIRILEPRHPNRSTGIINGRTSGILNWNDIPYPSFYRAYKELSTNFWIPDEVDMKGDARQYGELSAREKNAFDSIIGLLATLDSPQTRFIIAYAASYWGSASDGRPKDCRQVAQLLRPAASASSSRSPRRRFRIACAAS